jgi:hypothetical protein
MYADCTFNPRSISNKSLLVKLLIKQSCMLFTLYENTKIIISLKSRPILGSCGIDSIAIDHHHSAIFYWILFNIRRVIVYYLVTVESYFCLLLAWYIALHSPDRICDIDVGGVYIVEKVHQSTLY